MRLTLRCISQMMTAVEYALDEVAEAIPGAYWERLNESRKAIRTAKRELNAVLDAMMDNGEGN